MTDTIQVEAALAKPQSSFGRPASRRFHLPFYALSVICGFADGVAIVCASLIGGVGYQLAVNDMIGQLEQHLAAGVLAALLFAFSTRASGGYQLASILSRGKSSRSVWQSWLMVTLLLTFLAFLLKIGGIYSRGSIICFAIFAIVMLLFERLAMRRLIDYARMRHWIEGRRAIIIGAREELAALDHSTLLYKFGLTEISRFQIPSDAANGFALSPATIEMMGSILEMGRFQNVTEIALALTWSETRQIELFREALRASPLSVQLLPDRRIRTLASNPSFQIRQSFALEVQRAPLSPMEQLFKRLLDVVSASMALLLLSPIMIVAALAVRLSSPGPILFRQRRNGFDSRQFVIYKFRSMRVMEDGCNVVQATRADPRITTVGHLLRQSSIDELPQFFNVLKGDMSMVGPRPHAIAHDDHYGQVVGDYAFRHHVKPGITGWAQVNGFRGETPQVELMRQRVVHDLWYINNWSLLLDMKIMIRTCFELIRRRNAF